MIDLHCHILPELDDGAKHLTESLEMARKAVEEGITAIVATPHHKHERYENERDIVENRVKKLKLAIQKEGIPLNIAPGQEVRIYGDLLQDYKCEKVIGLNNSSYILIEFPSNHVPRYAEQLLYDIEMKGLTPIIAHPERNTEIVQHPDLLYKLVKKGAIAQITAGSLVGRFGKKIQKFSLDIIEARLVHVIASDAHNVKNRSFHMQEAFNMVGKEFGSEAVYYFRENAEYIFQNEAIYKEQPERVKRKKFLGLF
ncbi:tyrosine-protein phosphatase [Bacillus alveayuensis]|uniref:tyrosine-protein phosphatase n=1 Tax=Aeribacillus alveayuensis TaxID=279215 RepID=UPI0005CD2516|nr:CpsB/CapC family capsule biosynthesis tyrosine phosphatase [Bacillus alveayuensis]